MTTKDDVAPRYTVVVTCVVLCHESEKSPIKALVLKRSETEEEGPGLWTIPGGKVEKSDWGESRQTTSQELYCNVLERAVLREIFQETGIRIGSVFVLKNSDVVFIRKDTTPTLVFRFWGVCRKAFPSQKNAEATEHAWVTKEELSRFRFIGNVQENIVAGMKTYSNEAPLFRVSRR